MQIKMNWNLLAGMSKLCSTDETRAHITGVLLVRKPGLTMLVATDGRCMGFYQCQGTEVVIHPEPTEERFEIVLPVPAFRRLGYPIKKNPTLTIDVGEKVTFQGATGWSQVMEPITQKFPEYKEVVPREVKPLHISFNADLMQKIMNASNITFGANLDSRLTLRGSFDEYSSFSVFTNNPNFYGIIMPLRIQQVPYIPEWVKA